MIQLGRYDAISKWEIVCRHWMRGGAPIDVGIDRHRRPLFPQWESIAYSAGIGSCHNYIRLKCAALNADSQDKIDHGHRQSSLLDDELSLLLREIGVSELRARSVRLFDRMRVSGSSAVFDELPQPVVDRLKEVFKFGALRGLQWTEDIGEIPGIDELRYAARAAFPVATLRGKRNVLSIFCAREYGVNDIIHIHDICPDKVTLVDLEQECLGVMQRIYPAEWTYICADYKHFLREAEERGLTYELIVTDPYEAMAPEVAFDMFPAIAARCTDMMVLHYTEAIFNELDVASDDLEALSRAIRRRTGVDVAVIEKAQRSRVNCWVVTRKRGETFGQ